MTVSPPPDYASGGGRSGDRSLPARSFPWDVGRPAGKLARAGAAVRGARSGGAGRRGAPGRPTGFAGPAVGRALGVLATAGRRLTRDRRVGAPADGLRHRPLPGAESRGPYRFGSLRYWHVPAVPGPRASQRSTAAGGWQRNGAGHGGSGSQRPREIDRGCQYGIARTGGGGGAGGEQGTTVTRQDTEAPRNTKGGG